MTVQTYRDLVAWQKARALVRAVYDASASWPRAAVDGLTDQARRAAASVPVNVAEAQRHEGKADVLHRLSMADGSLHEIQTYLSIAQDLGYLSESTCAALLDQTSEVRRALGDLCSEEWRPVLGYEGWYSVSSLGRVRRERPGQRTRAGTILQPQCGQRGAVYVDLCRCGVIARRKVHHLVARAFLGPLPAGHETRHKDGERTNNGAGNLYYRRLHRTPEQND